MSEKPWAIVERFDYIIVIPTTDIKSHLISSLSCECHPKMTLWDVVHKNLMHKPMIVHNSFRDEAKIDEFTGIKGL